MNKKLIGFLICLMLITITFSTKSAIKTILINDSDNKIKTQNGISVSLKTMNLTHRGQ